MLIKNVEVIGEEPVTLPEVKNYCRVDIDDDNSYLTGLIEAARNHIETIGRMTLVDKRITLTTDNDLKLPFEPFKTIESVTEDGVAFSDYEVVSNYDGECWISFLTQPDQEVEITYTCGFDKVPKTVWQAMLMLISHWYDNRAIVLIGGNVTEIDFTLRALIAPYKRWGAK